MQNFEKLGAFYVGRRYDAEADQPADDVVLYDAKDLTTHAVIIGMTGSGKTGLGIGLLEEAALDHVPVIAIDPKGDIGNLLLTFPKLAASDFEPWVNARAAADKGQTVSEYAASQAALWKQGLDEWGQDGERIARLRDTTDLGIYTPGSNAGMPVSVLKSFGAPAAALREDLDLYRERVQATATGILALIGIDADPVTSREHILIARLLDHAWQDDRDLDIASLIAAIQAPPMSQVGVMSIDSFFPEKDRFALAMRLNNLLAAPGFEAWLAGEPLSAQRLLYTESGKPRISVMSIAHLDDASRMFFVCMLLNELIAWMRAQPGTSSLRAILYMDEIAGYMPPVANPPSKNLFLTLLKQARAYGLGLVLATQNPVDLDYKGLSNAGTWFIGRLQTERDKARVMEGLEGAGDAEFDREAMERTIAGLGKRRFLLHNVHEDEPVVFDTRWAMSYLAGPLTRDQIRVLAAPQRALLAGTAGKAVRKKKQSDRAPALGPGVEQLFVPGEAQEPVYYPRVLAAADMAFSNARYGVEMERSVVYTAELEEGAVELDWDNGEPLSMPLEQLGGEPAAGAGFTDLPAAAGDARKLKSFGTAFKRWVRQNEVITLYRSQRFKLVSTAGETEGEFRARLQTVANEKRDLGIAKLRKRYATKFTTLENRLMRAEQAIEREQEQSTRKTLDTAVSVGTAILGALLGRKKLSSTSATKIGSAIKTAGGAHKEAQDVERARETAAKVRADVAALEDRLADEIVELEASFDAQAEELTEVIVRARASDVQLVVAAPAWMPYAADARGRLRPAWSRPDSR
jgi:hypothetical protein